MAPKYQSVADSLRQEIEDGVYSSKQLLPTEHSLCQRFQISRQTVRRALSVLEDEGLITRRQGSGSRLRERTEPEALLNCTVAVVTTYINDYIFPGILQRMETILTAHSSARAPRYRNSFRSKISSCLNFRFRVSKIQAAKIVSHSPAKTDFISGRTSFARSAPSKRPGK